MLFRSRSVTHRNSNLLLLSSLPLSTSLSGESSQSVASPTPPDFLGWVHASPTLPSWSIDSPIDGVFDPHRPRSSIRLLIPRTGRRIISRGVRISHGFFLGQLRDSFVDGVRVVRSTIRADRSDVGHLGGVWSYGIVNCAQDDFFFLPNSRFVRFSVSKQNMADPLFFCPIVAFLCC